VAYGRPANLFVADFVGSPPIDLIEGKLVAYRNNIYLEGETISIMTDLPPHMADRTVLGAIRPEDAALSSTPFREATLAGTIYSALPAGPSDGYRVDREQWEQARETYYAMCGWDKATGCATRPRLEALGLGWVADKLEEVKD